MRQAFLFMLIVSLTGIGCSTINEASREQMKTDIYRVSDQNGRHQYTVVSEDSITMHPVVKTKRGWIADTTVATTILLNAKSPSGQRKVTFVQHESVFDVFSILFKYYPAIKGFPPQMLTNFNAAGFIGYGTDRYILSYDHDPLNSYQRHMQHFAYSFGLFLGLGAVEMTPSVTNNNLDIEYYGAVLSKGVAGMINVGRFRFGLAMGFDNLMDQNRKLWIYQNKGWAGFTVGFSFD